MSFEAKLIEVICLSNEIAGCLPTNPHNLNGWLTMADRPTPKHIKAYINDLQRIEFLATRLREVLEQAHEEAIHRE